MRERGRPAARRSEARCCYSRARAGLPTMPRLSIALLGGLRVRLGSGKPLSLSAKKAQALLAYLAVRQGERSTRDAVAALLWGDTGDTQARQNLRQTLVALRKALPRTALEVNGRTMSLNGWSVEVDVLRFERLAGRGSAAGAQQALAMYQGDLLEGFALREARFEDWLRGERDRIRSHAIDAIERLSGRKVRRQAIDTAIRAGLRLLGVDPLQEPVHRSLMRLYLQSGRRAEALRQYRVCADTLQRELGVQPDVATRKLYEQVLAREAPPSRIASRRHGGSGTASEGSDVTPLVGRRAPLDELLLALTEAHQGRGRLVTVSGEAGIGKSRLIQELAARAGERGWRVVATRCFESEQVLPFAPWISLLRSDALHSPLGDVVEAEPRHG